MINIIVAILTNKIVLSCISSYLAASVIKVFFNFLAHDKFDPLVFFKTGGMPSSHTATITGLAVSIYFLEGLSNLFFVCVVVALIVISDAMGVRRSAGKQAQVLNKMVDEFKYFKRFKTKRLYELLGHTPRQVLAGFIVGFLVTWLIFMF